MDQPTVLKADKVTGAITAVDEFGAPVNFMAPLAVKAEDLPLSGKLTPDESQAISELLTFVLALGGLVLLAVVIAFYASFYFMLGPAGLFIAFLLLRQQN